VVFTGKGAGEKVGRAPKEGTDVALACAGAGEEVGGTGIALGAASELVGADVLELGARVLLLEIELGTCVLLEGADGAVVDKFGAWVLLESVVGTDVTELLLGA